jgi:hypothetical protein
MEQEKIDRYLRWFEKGIRVFVGFAFCLHVGSLIFAGGFLWFYAPEKTVTLNAWELGRGLALNLVTAFAMAYVVFGGWHLRYTKKYFHPWTPLQSGPSYDDAVLIPEFFGKDW